MRRTEAPTVVEDHADRDEVVEEHPAFGMISASRVQGGDPVLFDSDIKHQNSVVVTIGTGTRRRSLLRDWLYRNKELIEVQMSEAQWASFVSSMNVGSGVPCTIRRREGDWDIPGLPYEPRMQESMDEVKTAASRAMEGIIAAQAKVEEAFESNAGKKALRQAIRNLHFAINNAPSNMEFAASSLNEYAEDVVTKARADIEAMVVAKAEQIGLTEGEAREAVAELGIGDGPA